MDKLEALWSSELSEVDAEAYDRLVATAAGGHYSQTRAWAKVAAASRPCTPVYFLARRNGEPVGAALVLRSHIGVPLPIAKVERGPVCNDPADMEAVLRALLRQSHRHGIARLSVMPYWSGDPIAPVNAALQACGFSDVQTVTGSHVRTLRLDLATLGQGEAFAGSDFTKLRKELRRAERAGAVARRGSKADLAAYRNMLETRQKADGKACPPESHYRTLDEFFLSGDERSALFIAEFEGEAVSAVFATVFGPRTYFVAGASSGRDLVFSKMVQPMAAAVVWAKQQGSAEFDFGGMPMAGDTDPKRNAIAMFKRSFSRNEIDLVHEHVRWF